MKLKEFRVREFRSVWDSGPIKVDERITCLVGKNEAGKTAILTALYRTNPLIESHAVFDETYDYPKREVEDYRFAVSNGDREESIVVECTYEIEDADISAVKAVFGANALTGQIAVRNTYYGKNKSKFTISVDDTAAMAYLADNRALPQELQESLLKSADWKTFSASLESAEATETIRELKKLVSDVLAHGLPSYVFNSIIWPRSPKYLYFDEYYQMKGCANLNTLINREDTQKLESSDYPLLGLLNLARLDYRQLVSTKNTTELKNKLEGAGNFLTRRIVKYWSQNQHIKMEFDVRDGKPEDPKDMRDGVNVWGEVHDTVHWAHTPLGSRSRGFVWFFSFLAWYEDVKRKKQSIALLLDEPGLSLHGRAQADLLRYFEDELGSHQLIYTTHSPFMIDPKRFSRVRIVQDLGIDAKEPLPKDEDGTRVLSNVFDGTDDSLFPLQGALGYEIHQTLFVGPNSLVVEGPADMLYLRAISAQLEREGRTGLSEQWTITPVGGSGKVAAFVALLAPQKGMNVATLLDIQNRDRPTIEDLYKQKLLSKKQVATYAQFCARQEADVEDMFERGFYVGIVNAEFAAQLKNPIDAAALNAKEPRTLRAIEAYLSSNSLKSGSFGHYRPARYFSENVAALWPMMSPDTKASFERAFDYLNRLLP